MATLTGKPIEGKMEKYTRRANIRRTILPYLYLVPAFLVMGVVTFYPLIYQVIVSFTDFQTRHLLLGLASPDLQNVGLQNYIDIITGGLPVQNFQFFRVLIYNFWWALTNVAIHVPAGIIIAVISEHPGTLVQAYLSCDLHSPCRCSTFGCCNRLAQYF